MTTHLNIPPRIFDLNRTVLYVRFHVQTEIKFIMFCKKISTNEVPQNDDGCNILWETACQIIFRNLLCVSYFQGCTH